MMQIEQNIERRSRAHCGRKYRLRVEFDDDTIDALRARAKARGTCMGEEVRLLVEWGLMDYPAEECR